MKPSDPMLLADVNLICRMYPAGKIDISQHLAISECLQSDYSVCKPSADAGSLWPPDLKSSSNVFPHLLGLQDLQQTPAYYSISHCWANSQNLWVKKVVIFSENNCHFENLSACNSNLR